MTNFIPMQTASFASLIETIFYIVVFYNLFRILARLLFPVLVKKAVEKASGNFQQQFNAQQRYQSQTQAGPQEIIFDPSKDTRPRATKKVGEYVDYEEID